MKLLAVLIIIAGVALAAYVGVVVLFIGGIENIVDGAKANPTDGGMIAWGAAQVFILAELAGGLIAWLAIILGVAVWNAGDDRPGRRLSNRQVEQNWERFKRNSF